MVAEPSQLKTANALTGVKSQGPNRRLLPRALVTQRRSYANMQPRVRTTEGECGLARIALGAEPNTPPIGECGGAHNWPALADIDGRSGSDLHVDAAAVSRSRCRKLGEVPDLLEGLVLVGKLQALRPRRRHLIFGTIVAGGRRTRDPMFSTSRSF
jgi:hypothetical protein